MQCIGGGLAWSAAASRSLYPATECYASHNELIFSEKSAALDCSRAMHWRASRTRDGNSRYNGDFQPARVLCSEDTPRCSSADRQLRTMKRLYIDRRQIHNLFIRTSVLCATEKLYTPYIIQQLVVFANLAFASAPLRGV